MKVIVVCEGLDYEGWVDPLKVFKDMQKAIDFMDEYKKERKPDYMGYFEMEVE